jgi:hypothetical protein
VACYVLLAMTFLIVRLHIKPQWFGKQTFVSALNSTLRHLSVVSWAILVVVLVSILLLRARFKAVAPAELAIPE